MQGLASVFIALSLLLSPLTGDHNANTNGMSARQDAPVGGPAVTSTEGHDAMTIRTDNSDCPIKYPNVNSKDYCECVVGRSDNFVCNYDCSCSFGGILCVSSSCNLSTGAILIVVAVCVVVFGGCGTGVICCVRVARRRRFRNQYATVTHLHTPPTVPHQQSYMYQQVTPNMNQQYGKV